MQDKSANGIGLSMEPDIGMFRLLSAVYRKNHYNIGLYKREDTHPPLMNIKSIVDSI